MLEWPRSERETVDAETPARAATSRMLARRGRRTPAGGGSGGAFTEATVDLPDGPGQPRAVARVGGPDSCKRLRLMTIDRPSPPGSPKGA